MESSKKAILDLGLKPESFEEVVHGKELLKCPETNESGKTICHLCFIQKTVKNDK